MGVMDYLKGFTPEINTDESGFDVLEGTYLTNINRLSPEAGKDKQGNRDSAKDCYSIEYQVEQVIKGNGNPGRKLWKRYYKDNEKDMKNLLNDLFTAGITLDTSSDEAGFEASFERAIGKKVYLRGWGWTPTKRQDGTAIPADEQKARQQFVVKSEKEVKGGKQSATKSSVPF